MRSPIAERLHDKTTGTGVRERLSREFLAELCAVQGEAVADPDQLLSRLGEAAARTPWIGVRDYAKR